MRYYLYVFVVIAFFVDCTTMPERKSSRESIYIITAEEIEQASVTSYTAFEIVQRLRPALLERSQRRSVALGIKQSDGRYSEVEDLVYIDGARRGGIEVLRMIPASDVLKIQYLTPTEATTRHGAFKGGGIFMVTTR